MFSRQLLPYVTETLAAFCGLQQLPPHRVQGLPHNEVETPIHHALRPSLPESPSARRGTEPALAMFVCLMLPEQHEHARKQPHGLLFEGRWRNWLLASESVS